MKKTLYTIALGLFILSAASCTDEVLVNEYDGLRVSGGVAPESRTTFIDDGEWTHTHWVANDAIGLYTDDQLNVSYKAVSNGSYSDFVPANNTTLTSEEGKKVKAYYPYSSKANGTTIPLPYTIGQSSTQPAAAFLYSEATITKNALNFQFKHLYAYLKLTISAKQFKDNLPTGCTLDGGGIYIMSDRAISVRDATYNLETKTITHNNSDNTRIFYYTEDMDYNGTDTYTYLIPMLPQPANTPVTVYLFYPQTGNTGYVSLKSITAGKAIPSEGFLAGNVYELDITGGEAGSVSEAQALKDFYQATNGSQWFSNNNWLSNMPVSEWYGINNDTPDLDYVYTLELAYNNLKGTLPETFAALMNRGAWLDISQNAISGTIPDAVKNHYKWNSLGWLVVPQDPRKGGGFDLTNSNLYMGATTTSNMIDGSTSSLQEIFKKNKLTQVICYNAPTSVNDVLKEFDAPRVNQHLDYQSKGFGTVIFTNSAIGSNSDFVKGVKEKYGNINGIDWMYQLPNATIYFNMTYVFDSNGQLVHIAPYSSTADNVIIDENYTAFLKSVFGEPVQHDKFSFEFYTSTDYSKDGEVFKMQSATAGKGINLVFIGEGFVDKDMASGGKYEMKMKEAADKLFEIEPYKSFRNRFNLYGVKVVSPTAEFTDGAAKRINEDYDTAYEYAGKYDPNLPEDARMMIIVVYNTDSYVARSYCAMFGNGDFVAFNMDVIDNTLIHEAGGHGFAKLADEYVEGGYEFVTIPQDEKDVLDDYHAWEWGWFANVDYHNTKSTIRWSRLLNDSRYAKDDIGIYEGAYTYGLGVYRPSENSMMRHNISWFNAPSRETIYKAIMTLSEGEGWTYNYEDFVAYDKKNLSTTSSTSRRAVMKQSRKEVQEIREKHRKPVFIQGSLRDAAHRSRGNSINVPLR